MMFDAESHEQKKPKNESSLLGESRAINDLHAEIERYANTPFPVLIQGESGTGKELVAELLHKSRGHQPGPPGRDQCRGLPP